MIIVPATNIGLLVRQSIWVKGDDGVYHRFVVDSGASWSEVEQSATAPAGLACGNLNLGNAIAVLGLDGLCHVFKVIGRPGAWTDTQQVALSSLSAVARTADVALVATALYVAGINDAIFHKFTVTGGAWTDSGQAYSLPF